MVEDSGGEFFICISANHDGNLQAPCFSQLASAGEHGYRA